jgi:hypothetical protein
VATVVACFGMLPALWLKRGKRAQQADGEAAVMMD